VVGKFAEVDLHPDTVSNLEMGYLYEELIRRFSELSNETAGEHFTPREVIKLMVNLLFIEDNDGLTQSRVCKQHLTSRPRSDTIAPCPRLRLVCPCGEDSGISRWSPVPTHHIHRHQ